jgi:hypothetical protein
MAIQGKLDISYVMRERALLGYSSDAKRNHEEIVPLFEDGELTSVWKWIYNLKYQFNQGKALSEYKGIYRVINSSKSDAGSTLYSFSLVLRVQVRVRERTGFGLGQGGNDKGSF